MSLRSLNRLRNFRAATTFSPSSSASSSSSFFIPTTSSSTTRFPSRSFQTSTRRLQQTAESQAAAAPARKPVGAFRGGFFGFLLGSTVAGASLYYYILDEYKISNEMLTEDIYALQAATQRIYAHVSEIENKMTLLERKK